MMAQPQMIYGMRLLMNLHAQAGVALAMQNIVIAGNQVEMKLWVLLQYFLQGQPLGIELGVK